MTGSRWAAAMVAVFLFARGRGDAQVCYPQPSGVDPVNGNFTPTTWAEGNLRWVNNAMGANFSGVWANTDFDVWFVGSARPYATRPIAVHFDGFSLQPFQLSGTSTLNGVWGSASNDVWAVGGNGLIVHWDGTQWVEVPSGTTVKLLTIAGTASDDVWAAGPRVMVHWDGSSWAPSPGFVPELDDNFPLGLAAISDDDALVISRSGCQRWDGASWRTTACGVYGGRAIFAVDSNDVWVVGYTGTPEFNTAYRAHWDGSSWSTTTAANAGWGSIGGTGPSDIWIDGTLHYDGTSWTEMNCGPRFTAMSVSNSGAFIGVNSLGIEYFAGNDGWPFLARTNVSWAGIGGRDPASTWAVGQQGTVIRYDGSRWSGQDFQLPRGDHYLYLVFGSSPSDIWAVSTNGLLHFDGQGWTLVDGPRTDFSAGFAAGPNDAILTDYRRHAWHWDGTSWSEIDLAVFGDDRIRQFWGTAADDVWAITCCLGAGIYHFDGDTWRRIYTAPPEQWVKQVGGSARDDVWFALERLEDEGTTVLHWDGTSFTEVARFLWSPYRIASSSPNDVWVMLLDDRDELALGELHHFDGASWSLEPMNPVLGNVYGVRGAGVFFATYAGHIYQSR